jgi:hypothetical protein
MTHYEHTQSGLVLFVGLLAAAVVSGVVLALVGAGWITVTMAGVFALTGFAFGALTVSVDETHLTARFGVGVLRGWYRQHVPLSEVTSCRPVRNRWHNGWGIRYIGPGWLYNVAGLDAVEVILASGTRTRIGTDEPAALVAALERSGVQIDSSRAV